MAKKRSFMSLSVFTNSQLISLDGHAKDLFMNFVLTPDEKRQIAGVQTYEEVMMTRAIALPLEKNMDEVTKKMILGGLADLQVGDRFLCNAAVIDDMHSPMAQYYFKIVEYMNDGNELTAEQAQAKARYENTMFDFQTITSS
jgi:hypothetical protein